MAEMQNFLHVGITVADLKRSIAFYEKLGFKCANEFALSDEFFATKFCLYHMEPGISANIQMMSSPNGTFLELFEFTKNLPHEYVPWNRNGITHICCQVQDVPGTYKELYEAGAFIALPPTRGQVNHFMFVRDPDGNLVEVLCPLALEKN